MSVTPRSVGSKIFDEEFYDIPNQESQEKIPIRTVSVFGQKIQVQFFDELFGETEALFSVRAGVALSPRQRGIHMSRIEKNT